MLTLVVILVIFLILSLVVLGISIYRNFELIDKIEELSTQVDDSLDVLEFVYEKIQIKSKMEVLSDDHVVRELVNDIKTARDAVMLVEAKLDTFRTPEEGESE